MCDSLNIVNPPTGSRQAGPDPDVNRNCRAGPSKTADKQAGSGRKFNGLSRKFNRLGGKFNGLSGKLNGLGGKLEN